MKKGLKWKWTGMWDDTPEYGGLLLHLPATLSWFQQLQSQSQIEQVVSVLDDIQHSDIQLQN